MMRNKRASQWGRRLKRSTHREERGWIQLIFLNFESLSVYILDLNMNIETFNIDEIVEKAKKGERVE